MDKVKAFEFNLTRTKQSYTGGENIKFNRIIAYIETADCLAGYDHKIKAELHALLMVGFK